MTLHVDGWLWPSKLLNQRFQASTKLLIWSPLLRVSYVHSMLPAISKVGYIAKHLRLCRLPALESTPAFMYHWRRFKIVTRGGAEHSFTPLSLNMSTQFVVAQLVSLLFYIIFIMNLNNYLDLFSGTVLPERFYQTIFTGTVITIFRQHGSCDGRASHSALLQSFRSLQRKNFLFCHLISEVPWSR